MMNVLKALIRKLTYVLSKCSLRNNQKAVFGCYKNQFSDNAKYLYLHWQGNQFIRAIWISGDKNLITLLNDNQQEAYYRWSFRGMFHCATAQYYCYCSYIGDINQYLAGGATKINLWHGLPVKKIEHDIDHGPLAKIYKPTSRASKLWAKFEHHQQYIKPDVMLSPSPLVDELFASAFGIQKQQMLRCGYPRTDYHQRYHQQRANNFKDSHGQNFSLYQYQRVALYVPSWRDNLAGTSDNPYKNAIDWQALSHQLVTSNTLLLVRLHPNERDLAGFIQGFANIIDVSHRDDVYDLLHNIDLLISDYSSLYIDALPLNIPLAFFQFDKEAYQQQCRHSYAYADNLSLPGTSIESSDQFINLFASQQKTTNFGDERLTRNGDKTKIRENENYQVISQMYWQTTNPNRTDSFDALEEMIIKQRGLVRNSSYNQKHGNSISQAKE